MFQRDYIMRIIEQFIRIISELIFKRKHDLDQDIIDQIYSASSELFGMDFHMLDMIKADALISFLDSNSEDHFKLYAFGIFFKEISHAQFRKGFKSKALSSARKAIGLLEHFLEKSDDFDRIEMEEHISDLADWSIQYSLQDDYLLKLFYLSNRIALYHKAENILFKLAELNVDEIKMIGIQFFDELLLISNELLKKNGLSENEVRQSYQDFLQLINK